MGRKYQMGRRFRKMKYVCVIAELLVIYVFHFLYQMLFPGWNQFALGVGFAAAAVVIAWGSFRLLSWCGDHIWYQITDEGLQVSRGSTVKLYPWSDFTAAGVDGLNILSRLPVWFQLEDGRRLTLEQYIEGMGSLTLDIIAHIEDHAEVSEELIERLKTAQAVQKSGHRV